jgi:tetratricopeptide (TPR) repeat protein
LLASGRATEAEQMLERLAKARPNDPEVLYRLGLVLLRNGKPAPARARLTAATKLAPEPLIWLALAQATLRSDDLAGAIAAAGRAREAAPPQLGQALALFDAEVIKYHLRKNEAKRSIELSKEALARSDLAVYHNLLGKAYDLFKDPVLAAEEMQQAIRLDASQVNYYIDLAELFLRHNTAEPAEMVLLAAVRRFPKSGESWRLLGVARYGLGKTGEALDAFLQAIDAAPEMEPAYASLETLLPAAEARVDEIIPRLRRFSETNPSSPLGPYLLALVVPDESEALLQKSVKAAPDFWPAWFQLHKTLKEREQWKSAAAALEKTVELKPDYAPAYYALAEYYVRSGDQARAAQAREKHHKLVSEQRTAAEKQRAEAPRLAYTLSER